MGEDVPLAPRLDPLEGAGRCLEGAVVGGVEEDREGGGMMRELWGSEVRKRRASLAANCFAFCDVLEGHAVMDTVRLNVPSWTRITVVVHREHSQILHWAKLHCTMEWSRCSAIEVERRRLLGLRLARGP